MEIKLNNCNCIDEASIKLEEKRVNIKYALNGVGKSTIAKAIELSAKGTDALKELFPFKFREKMDDPKCQPAISGIDGIKSVAIFNDEYIDQFVFKQDEVINNSFEIFVKNSDYDSHMERIEKLIIEIKETFKNSKDLEQIIVDLVNLSDCFGKSKSGYSAAGSIGKGIGKGNKVNNIPKGLESYSEYLKSKENVKWLKWQISGNDFIEISKCCPYCTSPTEKKKDSIMLVSKEYDAKTIEHLNRILTIFESLNKYFTPDTNEKLGLISRNVNGLSKEEIAYLVQIKEQVDLLKGKLIDLKGLTFFSFKDVDKVIDIFNTLKINMGFLPFLNSIETNKVIDSVNKSLDTVLAKAGELQGAINRQKIAIQNTIKDYKNEINGFLKYAGYKYHVDIEYENDKYKMKLKHTDFSQSVANGTQHLSYGETNAFALVLFMYETISKNPDIIILDDPISSFDRNKKYAIIDMLFRRKRSLKGKTILMMTHDLEPIVDMLYNLPHKFEPIPFVTFLESKANVIKEITITGEDIKTFGQICEENIASQSDSVIKLVYLRRYFEVINNKGNTYQLLSNLLHRREIPIVKANHDEINMTQEEQDEATMEIKKRIPGFDYKTVLAKLNNREEMKKSYYLANFNYEKLQIFRIVFGETGSNDIIKKFINETFHVENEYIMQLNPCKFEIIPQFIIDECDKDFV